MLFELLESRSLLSATALNVQIATDQLNVKSELQTFRSDAEASVAKMLAEESAFATATIKNNPSLARLFTAFQQEATVVRQSLDADKLTDFSTVTRDTTTVATDLKQYVADSGNTPAQSADRAQIRADKTQLAKDQITQLNTRIATRKAQLTTLASDANAIVAKTEQAPLLNRVMDLDINKFLTDHTSGLSSALGELNTLTAAKTQLAAALAQNVDVTA